MQSLAEATWSISACVAKTAIGDKLWDCKYSLIKSKPKPGSIIIDLAAESGGNCECSVAGETKEVGGVHVVGSKDITSTISEDASALFSKNILNFLTLLIDSESKSISIDWDDEIIQGILVTKNNEIVHKELS